MLKINQVNTNYQSKTMPQATFKSRLDANTFVKSFDTNLVKIAQEQKAVPSMKELITKLTESLQQYNIKEIGKMPAGEKKFSVQNSKGNIIGFIKTKYEKFKGIYKEHTNLTYIDKETQDHAYLQIKKEASSGEIFAQTGLLPEGNEKVYGLHPVTTIIKEAAVSV